MCDEVFVVVLIPVVENVCKVSVCCHAGPNRVLDLFDLRALLLAACWHGL
jgi:hypothetical protein